MSSQNFDWLTNQYQQRIEKLNRLNQDIKHESQLRERNLATANAELTEKQKRLDESAILLSQLQSRLSQTDKVNNDLRVALSAQSTKLELLLTENQKQRILNSDLIEKIGRLAKEVVASQTKANILQAEVEMLQPYIEIEEQYKRENEELKRALREVYEQVGVKSEENFRLSQEVIGQTKRFNELFVKFEKLDLALREMSEEKNQPAESEVEDLKDRRIQELTQEVTRLLGVIQFKNHLLSILDKDIYTVGKNYQIQGEAGQALSTENTLYFINKQLKAKSALLLDIRTKYSALVVYQQKTRELIQQYENRLQEQQNKLNGLQSQLKAYKSHEGEQNQTTILERKLKHEQRLREQTDKHLFDLLWENQALHMLVFEQYGNDFLRIVKEKEFAMRKQKGAGTGNYPLEFYYCSVQELVAKNRELMQLVRDLKSRVYQNEGQYRI